MFAKDGGEVGWGGVERWGARRTPSALVPRAAHCTRSKVRVGDYRQRRLCESASVQVWGTHNGGQGMLMTHERTLSGEMGYPERDHASALDQSVSLRLDVSKFVLSLSVAAA